MGKIKYLALLRGINVGGNNIIKKDELKNIFEKAGFTDITTYIQSGNIIFSDSEKDKPILIEKIKRGLFEKTKNDIDVILLTSSEIKEVINKKPSQFGEDRDNYKYDVVFLIEPETPKNAAKEFFVREGVDRIYEGKKVLYFSRLIKEITKSHLSKITGTPVYKKVSIRNWNTTEKLHELMNGD